MKQIVSIYFGNNSDNIFLSDYENREKIETIFASKTSELKKKFKAQELVFLRQVHSNKGIIIENYSPIPMSFSIEGDFIITTKQQIGIGIVSGDCLPIIVVDSKRLAVGIAHAGWRGSQQRVVSHMLEDMQKSLNTQLSDLSIYFGPCSQSCCYEVDKNFMDNLAYDSCALNCFIIREYKIYFNLRKYNYLQLLEYGVDSSAINQSHDCTICNLLYYSYRRQGKSAGRQIALAILTAI